jgi:hypothetical protein
MLAAVAALGTSGAGGRIVAMEPHSILFADGMSWRTLLRDREFAGAAQFVERRALADAVAPPAEVEVGDDAPVADGPIMRVVVVDGVSRWAFALAGDTLAFARIAPDYRLLDALDVRTDPGGFPSLRQAWLAAPGAPAALVVNSHFNSQEGFAAHTLLALVDGRIEPLWDGPLLYSVTTGDDRCDTHRIEQELVRFDPVDAGAAEWPAIDVLFRETESCEKDGTTVPSAPRDFAVTLQWDEAARRYVGSLPELEALNAERRGVDE